MAINIQLECKEDIYSEMSHLLTFKINYFGELESKLNENSIKFSQHLQRWIKGRIPFADNAVFQLVLPRDARIIGEVTFPLLSGSSLKLIVTLMTLFIYYERRIINFLIR